MANDLTNNQRLRMKKEVKFKCPNCSEELKGSVLMGSIKSPAKAKASKKNGFKKNLP